MPTSLAPDLHQQLKHHTHTLHQALHQDPLLRRLTQSDCTREEYSAVLRVFFIFYVQNEVRFSGLRQPKFHLEAPVLNWLQEDLTALGDDDPSLAKRLEVVPSPANFSQYVGYLYVKQGSTLGGQVLCRQLEKSTGLTPAKGLRFFYGFAEHTRSNWLQLFTYLDERQAEINISLAVNSACEHFRRLQALLTHYRLTAVKPFQPAAPLKQP